MEIFSVKYVQDDDFHKKSTGTNDWTNSKLSKDRFKGRVKKKKKVFSNVFLYS